MYIIGKVVCVTVESGFCIDESGEFLFLVEVKDWGKTNYNRMVYRRISDKVSGSGLGVGGFEHIGKGEDNKGEGGHPEGRGRGSHKLIYPLFF